MLWLTAIVALAILLFALLRAPWRSLSSSSAQHVFFGACVCTLVLWTLRIDLAPGLALHFIGITTLTLMFGWQLALVAAAIVATGATIAGFGEWAGLAGVFLAKCVVPAALSWSIFRASQKYLPHNFFIYIFVCAFFGAALAITAAMTAQLFLLDMSGSAEAAQTAALTRFLPLYAYPEAFLNGFVMTGMVVTRPHWVSSFDDAVYLRGK